MILRTTIFFVKKTEFHSKLSWYLVISLGTLILYSVSTFYPVQQLGNRFSTMHIMYLYFGLCNKASTFFWDAKH